MFSGKLAPTTAPVMVPQTAAPAPTPTTATVSFPAKVYFDVGTAAVSADGLQTIAAVADIIKGDNLKVAITGYTDKTGDVAANEELAESRTTSVRDALKSAGVAEANMEVMPPFFVEVGAGGSDVEARRVEINKQ
jgi:outer membrane protein OmpA-like peptidoglycan-associated protein